MNKQGLARNIFFIITGLVFVVFYINVHFNLSFNHKLDDSRIRVHIEQSLQKRIQAVLNDFDSFEEQFSNAGESSFSKYKSKVTEPVMIFELGVLRYWSDNKFIIDYEVLRQPYIYKLLRTVQGKFLIVKRTIGNYTIIVPIRLTYNYPIANQYLKSAYNADFFPEKNIQINSYESVNNIYAKDGTFLFSIDIQSESNIPESSQGSLWVLLWVGLILISAGILHFLHQLKVKYGIGWVAACYTIYFGLVIISTAYFAQSTNATAVHYLHLFFLASASSLFLIVYVYVNLTEQQQARWLHGDRFKRIFWIGCVLFIINYLIVYILFRYASFVYGSIATFHIDSLFDFNLYKLEALVLYILLAAIFFLVSHLSGKVIQHALRVFKPFYLLSILILMILCSGILSLLLKEVVIGISFVIWILYILVVLQLGLMQTLSRIRYVTYLYFFVCIFFCSVVGSIALYVYEQHHSNKTIREIADKVYTESRPIDEKWLNTLAASIRQDDFIVGNFANPLSDKQSVVKKITRYYLKKQTDMYEIRGYCFDQQGSPVDGMANRNYYSILNSARRFGHKTLFKGIYRLKSPNPGYFQFIDIKVQHKVIGHILLELKLRKVIPNSVFPELLVEKESNPKNITGYSYAIFDKGQLISSSGDFNYFKHYRSITDQLRPILATGTLLEDKLHKLFSYETDKEIVVSLDAWTWQDIFANFSFLFVTQGLLLATFIFSNTFYYKIRQVSSTFTTKIQLFINFAFFLPLVVVSVATFYVISSSFKEELQQNFIKSAQNISLRLTEPMQAMIKKGMAIESIGVELNDASRFAQTDIILYDVQGMLLASTQPKIFEYGLLSGRVNPDAYEQIVENHDVSALESEMIGQLKYNTVYYGIKSFDSGQLLGILAVPFFGSNREIQSRILAVFATVLNIFTVIFILFLVGSFFASRLLTSPLILLTNKIKQTSLSRTNEPLVYKANDEIGMLVNEYNRMLIKLEDNKKALSASEKESAWREMARQVAHEIKNPLTPMKLTLQNMQRMMPPGTDAANDMTKRSIVSLLDQVENLSDIASSFSAFTQMPLPKREIFDIGELLQRTVFLFENKEDTKVEISMERADYLVEGDEKLMGRIIINLLTNAFESVPHDRKPDIKIVLAVQENSLRISIRDNGEGIEEALQPLVFQPNFSTKTSGSGIGLAVAKRGLEQMGGQIWFETNVPSGTTFYIQLKLKTDQAPGASSE